MDFRVVAATYDAAARMLSYTATGLRDGLRFTVSSRVKCLKDPGSAERLHMVVLRALTDHFKRPSPSGRKW